MKTFFFTAFICLFSFSFLQADPWDDLSLEEAQQLKAYIDNNPYIFDYCDCCSGQKETELLYVLSSEITECSWNDKKYSVTVNAQKIALFPITNEQPQIKQAKAISGNTDYTLFMNYTFGFNPTSKQASPLCDMVDYKRPSNMCRTPIDFPHKKIAKKAKLGKSYIKWWKKNVK